MKNYIYVFTGEGATSPAGSFDNYKAACDWIQNNSLSGVLQKLPLNIGVYDWVLKNDFWTPTRDNQKTPAFIQRFNSAYIEHWHFENGRLSS